ncbi:MAG: tRNA 4-thiouridine(8) synthase ThiI [Thermoanaerobaculia bacterium]|nr:tRNA 4-thiouridine(8) synthase ThiI [Thermoanaerobaculia bacterium]
MHHFLINFGGEITVKGRRTRESFVRRLEHNLRDALDAHGHSDAVLRREWTRIFVSSSEPELAPLLSRVFGVQSVARAEVRPWRDFEHLVSLGSELFLDVVRGRTFAVRARRGAEATRIPFKSPDVERAIGSRLLEQSAGVDLEAPEVVVRIELHGDEAWFFHQRADGPGGLPAGTEGRALALLSGGFDSPVAAWRMMRRGLRLDYVFFNLGGDEHRDRVLDVAKILSDRWSFGYRPKLHLIDLREAAQELKQQTPPRLWQVLLKRRMLAIAERMAWALRARGLVTGDALGQVSSQTLSNLGVVQHDTRLPVLRPLVGACKDEIFVDARRMDTYDASSKVPEYCGLTPEDGSSVAATHSTVEEVQQAERALDPHLPSRLLDERATFDLRALDLARARSTNLAIEDLDALGEELDRVVWIDLRSRAAYEAWHLGDEGSGQSKHLAFPAVLDTFRSLDPDRDYVTYCEVGLKSAQLAAAMVEAGYRARHVAGGSHRALRWAERRHDPALRAALSPVLLDDSR